MDVCEVESYFSVGMFAKIWTECDRARVRMTIVHAHVTNVGDCRLILKLFLKTIIKIFSYTVCYNTRPRK